MTSWNVAAPTVLLLRRCVVCLLVSFLGGTALTGSAEADSGSLSLTLPQAIEQALRANPSLIDARLDRVLQLSDAAEAERLFEPQWRLGTSVDYSYRQEESESAGTASVFPGVEMELPTGGRLEVGPRWERRVTGARDPAESSALVVSLVQPLGRGAGFELARAPMERARLEEESHVLSFRGVLMGVVTEVVNAYRALIRAELEVEIQRRSLEDAMRTREVVRVLIETGRVARSDMIQSDADVSDQEIRVLQSRIALEEAQAALAILLGLDAGLRVSPADGLPAVPELPDLRGSLERALAGHPGYLQALVSRRRSELELMVAEDTERLDLSLRMEASFAGDGQSAGSSIPGLADGLDDQGQYAIGLHFSMPLGGAERRREERARQAASIGHAKASRALTAARRELEIEVRRATERVRSEHRQVRLAADALALAREQVRIEEGKLRLGLTSTYHMGRVRSTLVDAETREVNAKIDFLRALSELDRVEGAVLERWNIVFDDDGAAAVPELPGR